MRVPPKVRYTRQALLDAAFRMTRARGMEAVNARALAGELGCSTQPIFRAFHSMEEIKREMVRMGMALYGGYVLRGGERAERPYLGTGMAYIAFAREEPELFELLFMRDRVGDGTVDVNEDATAEYVIRLVMKRTGLARAEAEAFHARLWVFTHGLAAMIATRFLVISEEETEKMMRDEYRAMRLLYGLTPEPE